MSSHNIEDRRQHLNGEAYDCEVVLERVLRDLRMLRDMVTVVNGIGESHQGVYVVDDAVDRMRSGITDLRAYFYSKKSRVKRRLRILTQMDIDLDAIFDVVTDATLEVFTSEDGEPIS